MYMVSISNELVSNERNLKLVVSKERSQMNRSQLPGSETFS